MKTNGTATYQVWHDGEKIHWHKQDASITDGQVKIKMRGHNFIWDRRGKSLTLNFYSTYKLVLYELDGVVTVI